LQHELAFANHVYEFDASREALLHGCPGDGLVVLPPLQTQRICRMPNKHNAKRRHHIAKMKYSVRNWREYDAALRARGSLTMWLTPDAMAL
jgi:hypothetical protein